MEANSSLIAPDHIEDLLSMDADTHVAWYICASIVQQGSCSIEDFAVPIERRQPAELYELRVVHLATGHYLTDEGQPFKGEGLSFQNCEYDRAIERKDLLLARLHFVRVKLIHQKTGKCEEFTSRRLADYLREKRRYQRWKSAVVLRRLFTRQPVLQLYCPKLDPV